LWICFGSRRRRFGAYQRRASRWYRFDVFRAEIHALRRFRLSVLGQPTMPLASTAGNARQDRGCGLYAFLCRAIDRPNCGAMRRSDQEILDMKPDTHPDYHLVKVIMTDGTEFTTRTTWGKPGDTLHLDVDPKSHPAWTGGQQHLVDRGGRLSRFQKKFSGFLKK
jgi:large subunit ribosomal protein L31